MTSNLVMLPVVTPSIPASPAVEPLGSGEPDGLISMLKQALPEILPIEPWLDRLVGGHR